MLGYNNAIDDRQRADFQEWKSLVNTCEEHIAGVIDDEHLNDSIALLQHITPYSPDWKAKYRAWYNQNYNSILPS